MTALQRGSIVLSALSLIAAVAVAAEDLAIDWFTIDGGGTTGAGGDFVLAGTIGQPDAGTVITGGDFELTGGFWAASAPGPALPGDYDGDGDVDLADFAHFPDCMTGPDAGPPDPGCEAFCLDPDADVDLDDFGVFQVNFTGS